MEEKKLLSEEELGIASGTSNESDRGYAYSHGLEAYEALLVQGGTDDIPPKDRDIAMVFEYYALYPHMTVYDSGLPAPIERMY